VGAGTADSSLVLSALARVCGRLGMTGIVLGSLLPFSQTRLPVLTHFNPFLLLLLDFLVDRVSDTRSGSVSSSFGVTGRFL